MGRFFISFLLFLFTLSAFSQSKIKVHFPGAENQTIHIWTYEDYISHTKKDLGTYKVNRKGNFSVELTFKHPTPIYIQVQYMRLQLFIEPQRDYEIDIDPIDFSNRDYYPKTVIGFLSPNFKITKPIEHELNEGIQGVKKLFSAFVDSNYLSLVRGQNTHALVDTFSRELDNYVNSFGNKYLHDFVDYQLVELRLLSREYSNKMVVDKYFASGKLNLDDPYAMNFFNTFWSNYILMKGKEYSPFQLDSVINKEQSYQALSALLSHDPLLKDSILRELVIIRNIPQLFANQNFSKKALIHILYDISRSKISAQHREIATNMSQRMSSLQLGNDAPDFKFTDLHGNPFQLSDFEGKYIYLNIWNTECPDCLADMEYTKELFEEFDDIIVFISISVDADTSYMHNYIKSREFQWTFAHLDNNFKFLTDYSVSNLPRYILLNKEGKIEMLHAPSPSNHFSDYFLKMLNDKKGNLRLKHE